MTTTNIIEKHPYEPYVPSNASVLILGSFPGHEQTRHPNKDEWFYSAKRNKFWEILENVYSESLQTVSDKKKLFEEVGIGITDVILSAKRKEKSNLDSNLEIVEHNKEAIQKILNNGKINKVFFTSQFVQKQFLKMFPNYSNCECLPSPSPRYARISLEEKIKIYKQKLPKK